jgi:chromosome segregation ATPase
MSAPGDVACMWLTLEAAHAYSERMDSEIGQLEQKLATLIAHTRAMREANQSLRRDLVAVQEKNRDLATRMHDASARLDELLARMPVE